jgi:hypothetical protein
MPRFALVEASDSIVRQAELPTRPPDLPHKGWRWLPVTVTDPAHDSANQVKEGPVTTILPDEVTIVWTVRSKTAQELDADRSGQVESTDRVAFLIAFQHENRLRAIEGQPAVSQTQFRNALKALL